MDTRANAGYPGNAQSIDTLKSAGIPLRRRTASGILHWKMMLFAGQNTVEFGSANYSPNAFVPDAPYTNYVAESIYFSTDIAIVNSFKTKFDDCWMDTTNFTNYANVSSRTRHYPTYPIDFRLNFPPSQSFVTRSVNAYYAERHQIDAIMFRLSDRRHADAHQREAARRSNPADRRQQPVQRS
jgi:PLD-like domain